MRVVKAMRAPFFVLKSCPIWALPLCVKLHLHDYDHPTEGENILAFLKDSLTDQSHEMGVHAASGFFHDKKLYGYETETSGVTHTNTSSAGSSLRSEITIEVD